VIVMTHAIADELLRIYAVETKNCSPWGKSPVINPNYASAGSG